MPRAQWGEDAEFFGPRHQFRESLILKCLSGRAPGLHLECAAGLGSLTEALVSRGYRVVAVDASWKSLQVARRQRRAGFFPVVADICRLPFREGTFATGSCAETLEHVPEDSKGLGELFRVLKPEALLVGTVPYDPRQWSAWDDWAGHVRRYELRELRQKLEQAGFQAWVRVWGFPLVRIYDALFLKRMNRRRLHLSGPARNDHLLRLVARLGRVAGMVKLVRLLFTLDKLFLGWRWGVGLLFCGSKPR